MTAVHVPEQKQQPVERTDRRTRGLTIAVAVLAIISLGLGSWLATDLLSSSDTEVSADVQTVLDDYTEAFNTYDADAFLEQVTSDYRFYDEPAPVRTAEETAAWLSDVLPAYEFSVEGLGFMMAEDGMGVQVTSIEQYTSTSQGATTGVSVFRLVELEDAWKIQSHHVM